MTAMKVEPRVTMRMGIRPQLQQLHYTVGVRLRLLTRTQQQQVDSYM